MTIGASISVGMAAYYRAANTKLKKYTSVSILSSEVGLELIDNADGLIVERVKGRFELLGSYSYLFYVDEMLFYFKADEPIELKNKTQVKRIVVPT